MTNWRDHNPLVQPVDNPEKEYRVKFWARTGYVEREVFASSEGMAEAFARGVIERDGHDPRILSYVSCERIG